MSRDTSEKLTTLAVGGKAAGQSLTGTYGMAKFHVRQSLNFDYGADIPDEILTIGYEVYREMALRWRMRLTLCRRCVSGWLKNTPSWIASGRRSAFPITPGRRVKQSTNW